MYSVLEDILRDTIPCSFYGSQKLGDTQIYRIGLVQVLRFHMGGLNLLVGLIS